MNRTIRYRLHPQTQAKARLLHGTAGACRYVWNHFVSQLQDEYQYSGRAGFRFFTLGKQFTLLRKYSITCLQDYSMANVRLALKPLETNYQAFFTGQGGLPKFKGKYTSKPSFPLAQCGPRDNADVNAALNILAFGNRATGRGGGELTRPVKRQMDVIAP